MRKRSSRHTFGELLDRRQHDLQDDLDTLPPGEQRDSIVEQLRQIDLTRKMEGWLTAGLNPPQRG